MRFVTAACVGTVIGGTMIFALLNHLQVRDT